MGSERRSSRNCAAALAILLGLPWLLPGAAHAADALVARVDCERGVCGFNVIDRSLLTDPCADVPVQVAYRAAGGLAVVRCGEGPGREPVVYVFNRRRSDSPVFEVDGARLVQGSFLAQAAATGVPDRFGTVPLCAPLSAAAASGASSGAIWLVLKAPAADRPGGACYRLLRAVAARQGVALLADDGGETPAAAAAGTPQRWLALVSQLVPLMQHQADRQP